MFKKTVLLTTVLLLTGCMDKGWEAFIHLDRNNWDDTQVIGLFNSLQECEAEALSYLKKNSSVRAGDFECGYNCDYEEGKELYRICEDHGNPSKSSLNN